MMMSIMYDIESYRDLRLCRCYYQNRVIYNKNFEENYSKYMGVLFDCIFLITGLIEDESIQNSSSFLNMELKDKENIYLINFKNNIQYIGEVNNDRLEGLGKIFINGSLYYLGEFKNNLFDGKGILQSNFGDRYNGDFKKGCVSGKGKVKWLNGDYYEGNFEDNLFEGLGKFCYLRGDYYSGNFSKGKKHGTGNLVAYGPDIKLQVKNMDWYKGYLAGFVGEINFDSINVSESERKEVLYKGMINFLYFPNQTRRISIFPNGMGSLYYDKKLNYVGDFYRGVKHGKGKQFFFDGRYEGEFYKNRRHGSGEIYNPDEKLIFEGNFYSGKKHGPGWEYINGKTEFTTYKLGKRFGKASYIDSNLKPVINFYNGDTLVSKKVKDLEEKSTLTEDSCSICFNKFKSCDQVTKLCKCGHIFHSECLFSWLKSKDTCPLCRNNEIFKEPDNENKRKRTFENITN